MADFRSSEISILTVNPLSSLVKPLFSLVGSNFAHDSETHDSMNLN